MSPKRKNVLIIFLVLLAALLLLNGPVSRLQAATEISFSGSELLGNPTDEAITVNVVPDSSVYIYFEYGTASGVYTNQTPTELATGGEPHEVVISGLQADTEYYYRMRYAQTQGDSNYIARSEGNFHTARPEGSTYEFVLTADSHIGLQLGTLSQWQTTLEMIGEDNPDFMIDLGDTFAMDLSTSGASAAAADAAYLYQRDPDIMGLASHTVPIFLAMGNHENEEGWNFDDTNPLPVYGMRARKSYFPLPSPLTDPSFYSANTDQLEASDVASGDYIIGDDQYRENYYAWEWGDALFVVFDPFQYTMQIPYSPSAGENNDETVGGDRWNWTMGIQQHQWLRDTLANSDAKYKFLIAHHMVGGTENYVRGGAQAARWFEWGGCSANAPDACVDDTHANWEFDTRRPANQGWIEPVHQLMQEYGVQAFFHGHDHQFVHEERDGIVYQLVPAASQGTGNGFNLYTSSPYVQSGGNLGNSGYLRITVDPDEATVEYVKTVDNNPSVIGTSIYSYTIEPNETTDPDFTITASAGPNGSISPSGAIGVTAGDDQSFTITPTSGYQVADVLVDGGSIGAAANYTFNNVQADHTIAASFEPVSVATGEVTVDGAATSETADDVSSISFAHTTGTGTDRLMLVGASWNSGTAERDIESVTFSYGAGPTVLTLAEVIDEQTTGDPRNAAIYSLLNPPSGEAGTVTVTFDDSVSNGIVAGAVNFAGVDQSDPLGTPDGDTATSSDAPTITLTALDGDELVFDTVFQGGADNSQTLTPGADQSEQWTGFAGNTRGSASVEQATGSSVTMSWTAVSAAVWVNAAVPINPAPAGTTYDLTMAVTSANGGTTNPAIGVYTYAENEVVNISATANTGYIFSGWNGNADCTDGSVTMNAHKTCTANFSPAPPSGDVTVDGSVSSETADDVSSISFAHTTGTGADRLMLVSTAWNSGSNERDIESVTFSYGAGPTLLNLNEVIDEQATSQPRNAAIYSLLNPPSGEAGTVTITFNDSVSNGIVAGAVNFAGVDQSDPLETAVGATDSSTAPSVELTGLDGDELVFDTLFQGASGETQTVTPGTGQSGQWNAWTANTRAGASVEEATGSSVTMSWAASSSSVWVITAVPINPAPVGTTYDLTLAVSPASAGTTTPAVGVHTYAENEAVTIAATANAGYVFDSWSGDPDCGDGSVTMDSNKTCTANFSPAPPSGDVTVDGTVSSQTGDDVSSISFEHTTGTGINRLTLVGVSWNSNTTEQDITSVTFTPDGDVAIELDEVIDQQAALQPRNAAIYSLLNPASGQSGTVTVSFSGSVSSGIVAGAVNFAGVNQADPLGTAVGATATSSTAPTVTLTGLNGDELVFDTVFQGGADNSQTLTPGAGQAEQWNDFAGNNRAAASVEEAAGSSVTMSWTAVSTAVWVSVAVPINPAPAGTTYDLTMASDGNGTTTPSIGVHTYAENAIVNISATPSAGYLFDSWSGDADCADGSVTMDANKTCTANFAEIPPGVITFVGDVGTAAIKDDTINDLVVDLSGGVAAGNTIIIAYATNPNPDLVVSISDTAGNTYEQAALARNFENGRTYLFYAYVENALDSDDTITITQSVEADPVPEARTAVVSVFSGIAQNGLDQSLGNPLFEAETTASGTAPSVGPTGTTIQANELVFSGIGTNGPVGDAAGTWQSGYTTGPRVGTTGGDATSNWTVSTGWQIVSAIDEYSAGKSGVTDRQYAAVIATFRAAAVTNDAELTGTVTLQREDPAPDPSWSVPLTVNLYEVGQAAPAYSFTPTTDDNGEFTISGIAPGTYEIAVKHSHTLQVVETVVLVAGSNSYDFGTLQEGDANGDNQVDLSDFSLLSTAFNTSSGDADYNPAVDFNEDGVVDLADFSLLSTNFNESGETPSGSS